jgi:PAS domain S-box-containing protein
MPGHRKTLRGNARLQAAEELQRDSERQPHFVTDDELVAIAYCDTEARYKFVNRRYAERHGLMPEQVVGKRVPEVVGEQAWSIYESYFRECVAGKTIEFKLEIDLPYSLGERQFMHCCYEPEWRNRKVVGLIATITNIARRKRAEQRLRDNEITFRQLVETSPFGVYVVDADFRIVQVSAGAKKKFENVWPLIGRDLAEVLRCMWPDPFANDAISRFHHTLDTGEAYHSRGNVERRRDTGVVEAYDWQIERLALPEGGSVWCAGFTIFPNIRSMKPLGAKAKRPSGPCLMSAAWGRSRSSPQAPASCAPTPRCVSSWATASRNCSPGRCLASHIRTIVTAAESWVNAWSPESQTSSTWKSATSARTEKQFGHERR